MTKKKKKGENRQFEHNVRLEITKSVGLSNLLYADYTREDLENLTEWECQDTYGGKMPFCDSATCKHPKCHPLNDDRIRKRLGI